MKYKLLFFSLFFTTIVFAQKDIKIKEAKGEWPVTNITPEQALEKALTEAKFDALRQAGVGESVTSIESMFSTNGDHYYTGAVNLELGGEVVEFNVIDKKIDLVEHDGYESLTAKITINAVVREYKKKRDDSFQVKVEGIEHSYREGDNLTFNVIPYKEGFLKIFFFENDNSGSLLYPNDYEKNRLFEENKKMQFPIAKGFEYILAKLDNKLSVENNLLIFVYTKEDVPFYEENVNVHTVLNWVAKISPDKRTVVRSLIQVVKRGK
jgi:hypothetical protein